MEPKFSILIVCLNPGNKLKCTLDSVKKQTFHDYEIIVKDGLSTDGSTDFLKGAEGRGIPSLVLSEQKDSGIYDAMNQAVEQAMGRYVYFLNCGDTFYDENVLSKMAELIEKNPAKQGIYYGNIYERLTGQVVASNPSINAFACYRNVPCHQACFYDRKLLLDHPFQTKYRVRADYEQFLWCFFTREYGEGVKFCHGDFLVADYEGGGFSETKENRKLSKKEHREIVGNYMSGGQILRYRFMLWITLAPLRTRIAQNEKTAGFYNRFKKMLYGGK